MASHRGAIIRRAAMLSAELVALAIWISPASAQWIIASPGGDTLRLGYLVQARGEWQHQSDGPTAQNLFLRHLRVLAGGRVRHSFTFFIGADTPNMGKALSDGTKNNGAMGIYDIWITYEPRDEFKLDMGLIGTPNSHNSIQSISGMLAPDFGPYSFVSTPPTGAKAGRDYGVQARGYVLGRHVEYRAGAFQGFRGAAADHELRYLARVVVDAYQAERSVYYSGTTLGARRNFALGASVDHQEHYNSVGGDLYIDRPVGDGDAVSIQADVVQYDGGKTFTTLPRQDTWLAEVGYFSKASRVAPFVQLAAQRFTADSIPDQRQTLAGIAYFAVGHKLNVKAAAGRSRQTSGATFTIFQLTFQSFEF